MARRDVSLASAGGKVMNEALADAAKAEAERDAALARVASLSKFEPKFENPPPRPVGHKRCTIGPLVTTLIWSTFTPRMETFGSKVEKLSSLIFLKKMLLEHAPVDQGGV
jgi:hypothetical protein